MRNLIRIEELFLFLFSIFLFAELEYEWWWYAVLFLTPDLGMLGYLINPQGGGGAGPRPPPGADRWWMSGSAMAGAAAGRVTI